MNPMSSKGWVFTKLSVLARGVAGLPGNLGDGMHIQTTLHNSLGILMGITLSACAWLPNGKPETQPQTLVEIISGGLLVSRSGMPELGLMLVNTSTRTLWVSAHFKTPGGVADCLLVKELEPLLKQVYLCPQANIRADNDYPIRISIFADLRQTHLLGSLETSFRFDQNDVKATVPTRKP